MRECVALRDRWCVVPRSSLHARRFPPAWSVEEMNDACFIFGDRGGAGPTAAAGYFFFPRTRAICAGIVKICSSSLLKNLEIGGTFQRDRACPEEWVSLPL